MFHILSPEDATRSWLHIVSYKFFLVTQLLASIVCGPSWQAG